MVMGHISINKLYHKFILNTNEFYETMAGIYLYTYYFPWVSANGALYLLWETYATLKVSYICYELISRNYERGRKEAP